jgi:hypothetical protein
MLADHISQKTTKTKPEKTFQLWHPKDWHQHG